MVRREAAQRQQQQDEAERQAAEQQQGAPLRAPTRPADLPVYGQQFLSRA
jgi:hypothetical protein